MYLANGYVRAYTFDFCSFLSVAYTTLHKMFAVFYVLYLMVTVGYRTSTRCRAIDLI